MTVKVATTDSAVESGQTRVIAFLSDPASYPDTVRTVKQVETHAARVFLAGRDAFKIKKAVTLPYLDFGTLGQRRAACEYELEINQPHAPEIYLDVVAITREATGELAFDGAGIPVEWALHMRRFPDNSLLADLLGTDAVTTGFMDRLADEIVRYQAEAPVVRDDNGAARVAAIVDELCDAFDQAAGLLPLSDVRRFDNAARAALSLCLKLLDERGRQGYVRRCHGDLHLANIIALNGRPVLFDAIEFNDEIATVDVMYDLAFLLMDLGHCGQASHANRILNRYLSQSAHEDHLSGMRAMPLFMACRAGIRAMVGVTRLQQSSGTATDCQEAVDANAYLTEAIDYLTISQPRLIAIGGLSGSGKTSVARELAARVVRCPGAVHLRSDVERKRMFGVGETVRLPADTYTREASAAVYRSILSKAGEALRASHPVIVDAAFLNQAERFAVEQVASAASASFSGLWLEADEERLIERVRNRKGDASDATAAVVRQQSRRLTGPVNWHRINAGGSLEETVQRSLNVL